VDRVGGEGSFKIYLFIFGLGVMGYWVLEEGVFGFFLLFSGEGVRVVVCFFRIFYFIGMGKKDFWTWAMVVVSF
jgi:hypothetical protein